MHNGIIEYAELEGIYQDHQVKLLVLHKMSQESHHVCGSIVQTLLELCQANAVTTFLGSCSSAQSPFG